MEISVIVTVHNAEHFLKECLDSVISQSFSDIEILCMDGGSTDASPGILCEYAKKDRRICIINDANTSYGHKVNEGIRRAKGKYISVLESDDLYQRDMLEKLYEIMEKYGTDFVDANYLEFMDVAGQRYYNLVRMYPDKDYNRILENRKYPEIMRQIPRYWTGLFRKDFLIKNYIYMNESPGAAFQDLSFRFLTSALAETVYHVDMPVYFYREDNPGSSVHDPNKAVVTADEFNFLKKELIKRKIKNTFVWQHFYTWKYNDLYANLIRFQGEARNALWERTLWEVQNDRDIMEKNHYDIESKYIRLFLENSEEKILEDVESAYQTATKGIQRRRNFYHTVRDSQIVIFGCGRVGEMLMQWLSQRENIILCLTDNQTSLWGKELNGKQILSPQEAVSKYPTAYFVVASKYHAGEMKEQMRRLGVSEEHIIYG